jgi:histidinol-phosphate aminotransferase
MSMRDLMPEHLRDLPPYRSARDEYPGAAEIYLDANENPLGSPLQHPLNRYPWQTLSELQKSFAGYFTVDPQQLFFSNGSNESIDLLIRAFCQPQHDNIVIMPPTFGMYKVRAKIHNVEIREAPLDSDFAISPGKVLGIANANTKIIFVCSPNNPTGQLFDSDFIRALAEGFGGLVVIDEAYIEFSDSESATTLQSEYERLVILRTFSKAWGMASARLGATIANPEIIAIMASLKLPYNINTLTAASALDALQRVEWKQDAVDQIIANRRELQTALDTNLLVKKVFPSQANFLLCEFDDSDFIYQQLAQQGIIVRNVAAAAATCANKLRITVGTRAENLALLYALEEIAKKR